MQIFDFLLDKYKSCKKCFVDSREKKFKDVTLEQERSVNRNYTYFWFGLR